MDRPNPARGPHTDTTMALAAAAYVSDDGAAAEARAIFGQGWIGLGRADRLSRPGDYETFDLAGRPFVLVRDADGVLRLHANACRHRGARLLDGSGTCKGIRCPFHSWFYGLDGRLVSAPRMEEVARFDRAEHPLLSFPVAERAGFLFARFGEGAGDLDDHLGNFAAIHAPWPLGEMKTVRRRALTVDCNWKIFLEVFNEYYHLPFVHPDSINTLYNDPDPADRAEGAFASQFGGTDGTGALLETAQDNALPAMPGLDARWAAGARYTWVFPNMTFAIGAESLWVYEATPLGSGQCRVVQSACFHAETVARPDFDAKVVHYLDRLDAALDEDIPALENQQRGLAFAEVPLGPLHPLLESNVAAFARWHAGRLSGAPGQGDPG